MHVHRADSLGEFSPFMMVACFFPAANIEQIYLCGFKRIGNCLLGLMCLINAIVALRHEQKAISPHHLR